MNARYVAPSVSGAFNCPHCGAMAHQSWSHLHASPYDDGILPTHSVRPDLAERVNALPDVDDDTRRQIILHYRRIAEGGIFLDEQVEKVEVAKVHNLDLARCFSCRKFSVWRFGSLIHPRIDAEFPPNPDLPEGIRQDVQEAGAVYAVSPRACAALLRICVQKLCVHLGETGADPTHDVAALVRKGLDRRIQAALDSVRTTGAQAVAPGQIDAKDGRDTAVRLFQLVNVIAEQMITQPRNVAEMFPELNEV